MGRFVMARGCVMYTGDDVDRVRDKWVAALAHRLPASSVQNQRRRDGDAAHITVVPPAEAKALGAGAVRAALEGLPTADRGGDIIDVGVGAVSDVHFVVVPHFPAASEVRAALGLPPRHDFHITLGFAHRDVHDARKDERTLCFTGAGGGPQHDLGHLFLAAKAMKVWDSARLADVHAWLRAQFRPGDALTRWQPWGAKVVDILNHPARQHVAPNWEERPGHYWADGGTIQCHRAPRNFSFVTPTVAGSAIPAKPAAARFLHAVGVRLVISLLDSREVAGVAALDPLRHVHVPVPDLTPPTLQQMHAIVDAIEDGARDGSVLVHCVGGRGRTATALVCYLTWKRGVSPGEARALLDASGRRTTTTAPQDQFISQWMKECARNPLRVRLPPLLLMVGLPGSGKSTFATALERRAGAPGGLGRAAGGVVRLSQDDLGRKEVERRFGARDRRACTVVDRCNATPAERAEWTAAAHRCDAWCVFLDTPVEECVWRVGARTGHPTLRPGPGAAQVIRELAARLVPPTAAEGFSRVLTVRSQEEANALLGEWGVPAPEEEGPHVTKFPRTRHFANLGAATRDDLLLSPAQRSRFLGRPVDVEEKVDGANLGLSIHARTNRVLAQNRSHFVTSAYHAQFKRLDAWVAAHGADLWAVLRPGRDILYGEWLAATHSIPYSRLPDVFVAFDLYDRVEGRFFSRARLAALLRGTAIALVPLLREGAVFDTAAQIEALVHTPSRFYDGAVEGVYLRLQGDDGWLVERAKVVRADFLSGDKHWSSGALRPNGVAAAIN